MVIHANDTDIITICLYYAVTFLKGLPEMWVRTAHDIYLPVHEMAVTLGPSQCMALPFIHSMSGRDTTSYPYFVGKKSWIKVSKVTDIPALESFRVDPAEGITAELITQARDLSIAVYTSQADHFEKTDLGKLRTYKFLNNETTWLKLLPPQTEDSFLMHIKQGLASKCRRSHYTADLERRYR